MILGMEIAMVIVGLLALFRGRMTVTKSKVVVGTPARLLGLLALTPLPLALAAGIMIVVVANPANPERFAEDNKLKLALVEAGIVIVIAVLVFGTGAMIGKDPAELRRRRRRDDDEWDDGRPRRRLCAEDDEDRPRRRLRDEDEDEDRPRRRPRRDYD